MDDVGVRGCDASEFFTPTYIPEAYLGVKNSGDALVVLFALTGSGELGSGGRSSPQTPFPRLTDKYTSWEQCAIP